MTIGKFVDYFIHPDYFGDFFKLRKARLFVRACLLTSIFSISYVILSIIFDYEKGLYLTGFNVVGFFVLTFLQKTKLPMALLGNLYVLVGAAAVVVLTYFSGGMWSAIYPWIIAIPVLALLVVNRTAGIVWGIFSYLVMTWMGMLAVMGIDLPVEYNVELRTWWFMSIGPGLLLIIMVVSLVFEYTQTRALQDLQTINRELAAQKEIIAEQSQRLEKLIEDKDHIIRIMAHDLKNPLSNITSLSILMSKDHSEEEAKRYVSMIEYSSNNAYNLINKVLEMNALDQGFLEPQLEAADLVEVVGSVLRSMNEPANSKGIELKTDFPDMGIKVQADKTYLYQIVQNLVSNAVKFSENNTQVIVKGEVMGEKCVLKVIDQGPGIKEAEQQKLFGKFSRLSNRPTAGEDSSGLGLSLVKQYVAQMNGNVYYEPGAEKGSVFVVELVVAPAM